MSTSSTTGDSTGVPAPVSTILPGSIRKITIVDGSITTVAGQGNICLNDHITLKYVLHVPELCLVRRRTEFSALPENSLALLLEASWEDDLDETMMKKGER
ncbi:protein PHYLLO, chloroplastic-like isoform X3 [Senna tora]|uniref:Protein PHYLLO, chloroplastic-like isoform X3 n=1 Tax=Senna tora TaxID=362788 RepID=A0A835C8A6_9FABA|nr:protein PHYLLO, chloroplastic-like isoform X3 [Senna tora]